MYSVWMQKKFREVSNVIQSGVRRVNKVAERRSSGLLGNDHTWYTSSPHELQRSPNSISRVSCRLSFREVYETGLLDTPRSLHQAAFQP